MLAHCALVSTLAASFTFPVFTLPLVQDRDPSIGCYFVDLMMGTPARSVRLMIDTGTDTMTVSHKILGKDSSTLTLLRAGDDLWGKVCLSQPYGTPGTDCIFQVGYIDKRNSGGQYARDFVRLPDASGKFHKMEFSFGHVTKGVESMVQNSHGLLGLGLRREGTHQPPGFLERLWNNSKDTFSLCFGFGSGRLSIGRANTDLHFPRARSISLKSRSTSLDTDFVMELSSVQVDDILLFSAMKRVPQFTRKVIFDSGANQIVIPTQLWESLEKAFVTFCTRKPSNCGGHQKLENTFLFSVGSNLNALLPTFPQMTFTFFGTKKFVLQPRSYLKRFENRTQSQLQHSFSPGVDAENRGYFLFGAPFMLGHDFTFDAQNRQITITPARCETKVIVTNTR